MPVVGFLSSLGRDDDLAKTYANGFRSGLSEVVYVEGHNVTIEYRFAENQRDRLPGLVTDLVGRKVAVIAATGGGASILAAKAATPERQCRDNGRRQRRPESAGQIQGR